MVINIPRQSRKVTPKFTGGRNLVNMTTPDEFNPIDLIGYSEFEQCATNHQVVKAANYTIVVECTYIPNDSFYPYMRAVTDKPALIQTMEVSLARRKIGNHWLLAI